MFVLFLGMILLLLFFPYLYIILSFQFHAYLDHSTFCLLFRARQKSATTKIES